MYYQCTIRVPSQQKSFDCEYNSTTIGRHLHEFVCEKLNCSETYLWGLQYTDGNQRAHWLKLEKLIRPQVKDICPVVFDFVLKVYPDDPQTILDADSRQLILHQLIYDILNKPLICSFEEAVTLVAIQLQRHLGTFNPAVHQGHYAKEVRALKCQTIPVEVKAMILHQTHMKHLNPVQCDDLLLRMACTTASYGAQVFDVVDESGTPFQIGITRKGIFAYIDNKLHHYDWENIGKVIPRGSELHVHLKAGDTASVVFHCRDDEECDYIFEKAIEQQVYVYPESEFVTESESTAREEEDPGPKRDLIHKISGSSVDGTPAATQPEKQQEDVENSTDSQTEKKQPEEKEKITDEEQIPAVPLCKYSWRKLCAGVFMYSLFFGLTVTVFRMFYSDYWHSLGEVYDSLCTGMNRLFGRETTENSYFPDRKSVV